MGRPSGSRKPTVCMVSDFFVPQLGGVEMHIWSLSEALVRRGHRVVVATHAYPDHYGVRYFANGIKAYYLPVRPFVGGVTFPTIFGFLPLLRDVFLREGVDIVHGHTVRHPTPRGKCGRFGPPGQTGRPPVEATP